MTVSNKAFLKATFDQSVALGDKIVSSDANFVMEGLSLLIKQFPWPILSSQGEIEAAGPMGTKTFQPQQVNTALQGPVAFYETKKGDIQNMLEAILENGGRFNARVYEGPVEAPLRSRRIKQCFFQLDNPDRDFENRAQLVMITGTLFFHFHGEE